MIARSRRAHGLTLIEVMMGVLALSILLSVMWGSISAGLQAERNAEMRGAAIRIASSELARARSVAFDDLEKKVKGTREEVVGDWTFTVSNSVRPLGKDEPPEARRIVTIVTWKARGRNLTYRGELVRSRL